jgi:predicted dehydrogenase
MKKKSLGFGIIGTGSIAAHHAKSIEQLDDCHLVAVLSSSAARAAEAGDKYKVPGYENIDEFLKRDDIDVVCVCTASGKHLEPTLAAAKAGKHVLTEKPLEVNLERADQMIAACRSYGVKLGCIFQNRFKPDYLKVKEAVEKGSLGKLIMGNAYIKWYRDKTYYSSSDWKGTLRWDGGAALINQGIHTIDLLLDIMPEVESVYGQVKTAVHKIEGEDLAASVLNFQNGAIGSIEGGTSLYPGFPERLEIFGQNGSIILEGGKITQWNISNQKTEEKNVKEQESTSASDPMAVDFKFHMLQIKDMVDAINDDREPAVNGESARKSLELILAIYKSSNTNKAVQLTTSYRE